MTTPVTRLLALAASPLGATGPRLPADLAERAGRHAADWSDLLSARNGWLAFDGALHLLPVGVPASGHSVEAWNAPALWREAYGDLITDHVFFAEDLFGEQFCFHDNQICQFNPETADTEPIADTLSDWAAIILSDPEVLTGLPLAREWAKQHVPVTADQRLVPKMPFVLNGAYELDNLYASDPVPVMRFRGDLARQLKDVPDGTSIQIRVTD